MIRSHWFDAAVLSVALTAPMEALGCLPAGDYALSVPSGGLTRSYLLHVPGSVSCAAPPPLVVDFHPFTWDGQQQRDRPGNSLLTLSESEGFIAAWPNGISNSWNGHNCCGEARQLGIDDVGFARDLMDDIAARTPINRDRVYATGHSNGGALSGWLACNAADVFAAVAPTGFTIPVNKNDSVPATCPMSLPTTVAVFIGRLDPNYNGNLVFRSAAQAFTDWKTLNGCQGTPVRTFRAGGTPRNPATWCDTYQQCAGGVEVTLCSVLAGHELYASNPHMDIAAQAWGYMRDFSR